MLLRLAHGVKETVAGHRLGALEGRGGAGTSPPPSASLGAGAGGGVEEPLQGGLWPPGSRSPRWRQSGAVLAECGSPPALGISHSANPVTLVLYVFQCPEVFRAPVHMHVHALGEGEGGANTRKGPKAGLSRWSVNVM